MPLIRRTCLVLFALVSSLLLDSCGGGGGGSGGSTPPPPPPPAALTITTSALANAQVGTAYTATLAATGGTAPYTWALMTGTFPPNLSLDAKTGTISGTPIGGAQGATLEFAVTDSATPAASRTVTLTLTVLGEPLRVTTNALPVGHVTTAYDATLSAAGGLAPYTWTLTGGTLPAGLHLDGAAGTLTGTPTQNAQATPLTFTVTDSATPAATRSVEPRAHGHRRCRW